MAEGTERGRLKRPPLPGARPQGRGVQELPGTQGPGKGRHEGLSQAGRGGRCSWALARALSGMRVMPQHKAEPFSPFLLREPGMEQSSALRQRPDSSPGPAVP